MTNSDVDALRASGVTEVYGAHLAKDDVNENTAAALAAKSLVGTSLQADVAAQGRCNLRAQTTGLLLVDIEGIVRLNIIDEALTLATLPTYSNVRIGQVVATVKCIPLAVERATLQVWQQEAAEIPPLANAPYRAMRVSMICSRGSSTPETLLSSTEEVTRRRVEALGGTLIATTRCAHDVQAVHQALLAAQGADLILISGAAVSKDRGDTSHLPSSQPAARLCDLACL